MGWSYRRSIKFGPFRMNFSKSGVGYSVGSGGFRTGVRPNGRRYTRLSIPGSGLSYTTNHTRPSGTATQSGCLVLLAVGLVGAGIGQLLR